MTLAPGKELGSKRGYADCGIGMATQLPGMHSVPLHLLRVFNSFC